MQPIWIFPVNKIVYLKNVLYSYPFYMFYALAELMKYSWKDKMYLFVSFLFTLFQDKCVAIMSVTVTQFLFEI